MHSRVVLALVVVANLLACSDRGGAPNARGGGPGDVRNGLGDHDVAAALSQIHTTEIEQGELALARAHDPAVRAYADSLTKQFTRLGHEHNEVLARSHMPPRESALSRTLAGQSLDTLRTLDRQSGPMFDARFLETQQQTTDHALSVIDGVLVPNTHNPALRNDLEKTRGVLLRRMNDIHAMLSAMRPESPPPRSQVPLRGP